MELHVDAGKALLVIAITIIGVIFVNVAIYYSIRGKGFSQQIDMFRNAARKARNPWEFEDKNLEDLSALVKKLQEPPQTGTGPDLADNQKEQNQHG
jgi:hypothetical protein